MREFLDFVTTKEGFCITVQILAITLFMVSPVTVLHAFEGLSLAGYMESAYAQEKKVETVEKVSTPVKEPASNRFTHLRNEENEYLVARIIASEYRSQNEEDMDKKVAVGIVVLNRVLSPDFPDTVEGVIFQKNQFQPTFDGSWEKNLPTEFDMKAARLAFEDHQLGESLNESLFFMNPAISNPKNVAWFRNNLSYVGTLGAHEFYK